MINGATKLLVAALLLTDKSEAAYNYFQFKWTTISDQPGLAEVGACYSAITALTWGFDSTSSSSSSSSDAETTTTWAGHGSGSDSTWDSSSTNSPSSSAAASLSAAVAYTKGDWSNKGHKTTSDYSAICEYAPASGSFMLCVYQLAGNSTSIAKAASKTIAATCVESVSAFSGDYTYFMDQLTNATKTYMPLTELNTKKAIYTNTYPNMTSAKTLYTTYKDTYFQTDAGTWFSVAFFGYFLFLFVCSFIYNFLRLTGFNKKLNRSMFSKLCQKYIIFPSLIPNGKYSEAYGWKFLDILPPNRIQFLVDLFFFGLEVAFYCVPYQKSEWVRWVGYRSGIMAFGKLPLLILFAGRNNLMIWLTGWSYDTFMHYHKIISSYMFVDALIHSVAYTIQTGDYYSTKVKSRYFACGVAATVFAGVILIQSFHVFRTFGYEYFLTIHVVLVICYIATCWWHCINLGWMEWMVASCCVWFFDRLIRAFRMTAFGFRKSTITAVSDDLMKIAVSKPNWWMHTPGTFAYIYFGGIIFWENHPFTVVVEDDCLVAYIKVKRGVTARMWKKLMKKENKTMSWRVCLEGPYGGSMSTMHKKYDDAIFIAGGSGVPGILEGALHSTQGKFIWVAQTLEHVTAYHTLIQHITIPMDIYITRETADEKKCSIRSLLDNRVPNSETESQTDSTDTSDKDVASKDIESIDDQVSIHYSKPNMKELIEFEIEKSPFNNVCVTACGPPVMMDEVRNIIADNITKWDKSIDFFDEFQIW